MRPPIVIDEHGDIDIFPSVEAAARYIEPIDVLNNEFVAYDSLGFLRHLDPTEPVVGISGYLSDDPCPDQLDQALRSFVERASGTPVPTDVTSLEGLLAFCVRKFGYTE